MPRSWRSDPRPSPGRGSGEAASVQPSRRPGAQMGYYIYQDAQEYWRWYLLGADHRRIAESSQGYDDPQACRDAIALVKGSAAVPVHEPPPV